MQVALVAFSTHSQPQPQQPSPKTKLHHLSDLAVQGFGDLIHAQILLVGQSDLVLLHAELVLFLLAHSVPLLEAAAPLHLVDIVSALPDPQGSAPLLVVVGLR